MEENKKNVFGIIRVEGVKTADGYAGSCVSFDTTTGRYAPKQFDKREM
jgi:hypothetical protein